MHFKQKAIITIDLSMSTDSQLISGLHSYMFSIFKHTDYAQYKPIPHHLTQQEIDFIVKKWSEYTAWTIDHSKPQIKLTPKQRIWMVNCYVRLTEYYYAECRVKVVR